MAPRDAWAKAEAAAKQALQIDDQMPDGHVSLGLVKLVHEWDWGTAKNELLRAIEVSPNDEHAHSGYAFYLRMAGRMDEALQERRWALELDPLRVDLVVQLADDYVFTRRYDEAIAEFRKALELEATYIPAVDGLADAYARKGMYREAAPEELKLLRLRNQPELAAAFDQVNRSKGYVAATRLVDENKLQKFQERPELNQWNLAYTYARLADKESALRWLEMAYQQRDPGVLQIRVDPDVDSLRSDFRFQDILRRLGTPP
jgi:tetratricopeptide (TPR) repeat protein